MVRNNIRVLLTTEGTYPFHQGGVSTWCDTLVKKLPSVDFMIYSVLTDPFVTQKYKLPKSSGLIRMPLWGTEEPSEHLTVPFAQVYAAKRRTNEETVKAHFIPLFIQLIQEIVRPDKNPLRFSATLLDMYLYFQEYEYKNTFKSKAVWDEYKAFILNYSADPRNHLAQPDVYGLTQSLGWIYRFLNIINTPIPKVEVTHATAAAFCGIPCVIAKMKDKTPYLLTEHGVYLREQYLSLSKREYSSFLNTILVRFIHSITSMNYTMADQVSPVCEYNTRWEKTFGVPDHRLKVIHNGVDKLVFTEEAPPRNSHPTVVTIARIDPNKDIISLIRSASVVRETVPDVRFIVYGSIAVPEYYEECLELLKRLGLEETFLFAGHTDNMTAAYASADVIALSSTSEAFPYSVVEAMMVSRPVIATDVGGVGEALGDAGILVPPCNPKEMAKGIIRLIQDPDLRLEMGRDARQRALSYFTLDKVLESYLKSYIMLSLGIDSERQAEKKAVPIPQKHVPSPAVTQRLYANRAYALISVQLDREAIEQFRLAIRANPASPSVPVLYSEIAEAYNRLGNRELALIELENMRKWLFRDKRHESA
ncbi:GT4 family glycosyltransferase PelF [Cohnella candidum]|uniref:DUF3492 domain-containing protein n=1 Tax=Cohnella candidum TaxID=2674991 RepID=A0A3G3JT31_9BACL|nr:GT4 family glycosyltransferase PelF [Cohnella candidum]AYQ71383.1 DUF3492 domain-containing protein [Cohnella candidum]